MEIECLLFLCPQVSVHHSARPWACPLLTYIIDAERASAHLLSLLACFIDFCLLWISTFRKLFLQI